jgi:pilus assembly protein CpaB
MKTARIAVLAVALAAGGGALYLVGGGQKAPQQIIVAAPAPAPQIETEEVLVAKRELQMGTLVSEQDIGWVTWPRVTVGPGMITRQQAANVIEDLKGSVSRMSFFQGEPIRREKLVKGPNSGFMSAILPSGMRAVAINIDTQGSTSAGGFVLPNDRVDVLRTVRDDEAAKSGVADAFVTEILLSNVRVLAIGQNVQEKNGERVVIGSNATLEVDPRQAETLILAQRVGQLSLALRSLLDAARPAEAVTPDQPPADNTLTIVRYGVAASGKR